MTDLLAPLRDLAPQERTTVDIGRAIRTGKRRKRTRTGLAALAAAVLTVLTLSPALLKTPAPIPEPAGATEFDLLRQVVRVVTAGGYTPNVYQTGRYQQIVTLSRTDDPALPGGTVTVFARGRHFEQTGPGWVPPGTPAPDVHGRRAVWPDHGDLAWEWSPGAWAVVVLDDGRPDERDRAHRVAQSVLFGAGTPVRVPLTVDGSTFGRMKLVGVRIAARPGPEIAALVFADSDLLGRPEITATLHDDHRLTIEGPGPVSAVTSSVRVVDDPANRENWVPDPVR
ncbi:hypothetical protein [Saccharothrix variisporea]|uniref:Uncharacterized protein n=1 Tax=Saccharothrix variisporea TaxID=543527 RepID=A0A495X2F0_9PSEU|nr:hypothetical protein [Saccharothrix variisporea]RKT68150.1 hypothetical protein DFJ66_1331 [Saccharothrix variisporea]